MWFDMQALFPFEEIGSLGVLTRALRNKPGDRFIWVDEIYWVYELEGYP